MSKIPMLEASSLIEQLPGYVLWKDMNSVFLKANMNTACLFGFKRPDELVGITDYDVRHKTPNHADSFVKEDQKVQCSHTTISALYISSFANDHITILLMNKSLFFDENAKPLGIACQGIELNRCMLKDMPLLLDEYSNNGSQRDLAAYYLNGTYGDTKLSDRQAQCLFYVLRGKTSKSIAKILQLSPRTVESYLDDIKIKMGCLRKDELIEKSIDLGFLEIIPPGIITHPFIKNQ